MLIVCGILGWFVYANRQQNSSKQGTFASQSSASSDTNAPISTAPHSMTNTDPKNQGLAIPELGIQIVNLPSDIKDLNYKVNNSSKSPISYTSVEISTITLSAKDPRCSPEGRVSGIGRLLKVDGVYSQENSLFSRFIKQFDGYWIGYQHPQSACSSNEATEKLHIQQTDAFQTTIMKKDSIKSH